MSRATNHYFMVQFVKILEYELNPENEDVFKYLCELTKQVIDPPSKAPGKLELIADVALCSPLRRSVECLKENAEIEYIPMRELREIPFDLEKICSREEMDREGDAIVRRNFKKAFIEDRLLTPRKELFEETKKVLNLCQKLSRQGKTVAVVSHSFRLKLIEAFLNTRGELEKNPKLIENYIFDDKKTYEFGEGFFFDV